jgi:hypothetical protein
VSEKACGLREEKKEPQRGLSAHIDHALRRAIDAREIPGVVAAVATDSEVIYQGAFGKREVSKP